MNLLDALANWATGFITAAVVAALSLGAPNAPVITQDVGGASGVLAWAQDVDAGAIQQVGEEAQADDADVEELDAGAPPVESASSSSGDVVIDQSGGDVELLDQGSPPAEAATILAGEETTAVETAAPVTIVDSAAPATSGDVVVETAVDSGPRLPEGFGEGQTLVSTASGDFPPGLDECHVGAVTGRAYVGIDCDDEGSSFVGHAPTFEDFPFVTDENFPFDNDEPIVADENFPFGDDESTPAIELNSESDTGTNVLVAAGGRREGPSVSLPEGSEGAVIERAQRSSGDAATERSAKKSNRNRSTSISVDAASGNSTDRVRSASKDSKNNSQSSNTSGKESKNAKAKHKQKAKKNKGKNKDKNKKANKNSKSDEKGKKADKGKKKNRKKNR